MSKKKLEIDVFSAWNTYAVSIMSVLEHCGMWDKDATFQKFMSVTGIASQFCVDANCSALPITDYDWMQMHTSFLECIGVRTKKYYASPSDEQYAARQQEAINALKQAIQNDKAGVVWGIDTGEFGVIYGYDDEDGVFFPKGIGTQNTNFSMPILYGNLGKTFEPAPVLYCEIPESMQKVDWQQAYRKTLHMYVQGMQVFHDNSGRVYGLAVYDAISDAVREDRADCFGLKYCIGIYYERKEAILMYLEERQKEQPDKLLAQLIGSFRATVMLYRKLMFEILGEGTEGWNFLFQPMNKDTYPEIIKILQDLKASEKKNIELAEQVLALICIVSKI